MSEPGHPHGPQPIFAAVVPVGDRIAMDRTLIKRLISVKIVMPATERVPAPSDNRLATAGRRLYKNRQDSVLCRTCQG